MVLPASAISCRRAWCRPVSEEHRYQMASDEIDGGAPVLRELVTGWGAGMEARVSGDSHDRGRRRDDEEVVSGPATSDEGAAVEPRQEGVGQVLGWTARGLGTCHVGEEARVDQLLAFAAPPVEPQLSQRRQVAGSQLQVGVAERNPVGITRPDSALDAERREQLASGVLGDRLPQKVRGSGGEQVCAPVVVGERMA